MTLLASDPERINWAEVRSKIARRTLPRKSDYAGLRTSWRADLTAGLTVAIIALPLALGFGVSSGVGAAPGLVTAVIAGFVAAVFGGSSLQVSGPTGAMAVVLLPIVARYGPESVAIVAIMAGGLIILAGLLGLGRMVSLIPWPVVEGFTLGIGVVILLQQFPLALGTAKPDGDNVALLAVKTLAATDWVAAAPSLILTLGTCALIMGLNRWRKTLPASLIAVVLGTLVTLALNLDVAKIGAIPTSLPAPSWPSVSMEQTSTLFTAAFAVAALAALESLLSARVADGMNDETPRTSPNRELFGQGLANIASGMFGAMPATGAIARTAVNVRAGGRTRMASAFHAVVLAGVVYLGAPLVSHIPLPTLAGVLIITAARMVDWRTARTIIRASRADTLVFFLTFGTTVVFDLVLAVEVGVAVAAVLALRALSRSSKLLREPIKPSEDNIEAETEHQLLNEHIAVYRIEGALFFGDTRRFLDELTQVADVKVVILRLGAIRVLDTSGAIALGEVVNDLRRRGVLVLLKGLQPYHRRVIENVGVLAALGSPDHLFDQLPTAIDYARAYIRGELDPAEPRG